jgi:hypothetical protein
LLGCFLAMPRRRGNARLIDRDTQQLRQVALDIVALDEAANDAGLDADGAAAASAAAARLLSWAQAQLKNTASVEDPAAAGSLDGGSGSRGAALHDGTTHGAAAVSASNIAEQQEQQEQVQPATASSTIIPTAQWPEPQLLPRAGPEAWERWRFARASGAFHKNQCGSGNAAGSLDAMQQMRSLTLVCQRPGCSALVDYKAARCQAKRARRVLFEPGDGCAGRAPCSDDYRASRFYNRQNERAAELESGKRLLVRWPVDHNDREVWAYPAEAACSAAASARLALQKPPKRKR